ncbi:MAG: hypothetical protein WA056_09805 [Gallionella sp.]
MAAADSSLSGQAIRNASGASLNASASVAHAIAASGQATLAVSAIPFAIGGSVGAVSGQIAKDSMKAANTPIGAPLAVTDEVLTIAPPNEALKTGNTKEEPSR